MLTGESRAMSPVSYIGEAVKLARKYFRVIGIEIYPLNVDEYAYLHECGVDYVTVFQETYDDQKYKTLHLGGHKRIFPYRLNAQGARHHGRHARRRLRGAARSVRLPQGCLRDRHARLSAPAQVSARGDRVLLSASASDHQ